MQTETRNRERSEQQRLAGNDNSRRQRVYRVPERKGNVHVWPKSCLLLISDRCVRVCGIEFMTFCLIDV
jgi:hypothetical protein